jgi:uncharacterized protein
VFSVVALYVYYPAAKEAFTHIVPARTEAITPVRTGMEPWAKDTLIVAAHHPRPHGDGGNGDPPDRAVAFLLTRELQVGVFIRSGTMDPETSRATEDLREHWEELRDVLLADDLVKAKERLGPVEEAYRKCRDRYQPSPAGGTPLGSR